MSNVVFIHKPEDYRANLVKSCRAMVTAGYTCIPLTPHSKIPRVKRWTQAPFSEDFSPAKDETGYGVVLPDNVLVIDIDPRNFAVNERNVPVDSFSMLLEIMGVPVTEITKTFTVRSGRDSKAGVHIWLRKPPGRIRKTIKTLPGIEFLSTGTYVVGPGSLHPDSGKPYSIRYGDPTELVPVPAPLWDLLHYDDSVTMPTNPTGRVDDSAGARGRYVAYLNTEAGAVEGELGDANTLRVALAGRDLGLPAETTFELMLEHYNPKCNPPWSQGELRTKVANAYRYGKSPVGNTAGTATEDFSGLLPEVTAVQQIRDYVAASKEAALVWVNSKNEQGITVANQLRTGLKQNYLQNTVNFFLLPSKNTFVNPLYQLLRFNQFSHQLEFTTAPPWPKAGSAVWTDSDAIQLKYYLQRNWLYNITSPTAHEAAIISSSERAYHPVKNYFKALRWDGKKRLDLLLPEYLGSENTRYTRAVGACTMIAAVARIYEPGCKFDNMLILEGAQGIGKSTFCNILGRDWYMNMNLCFKSGMKEVTPLMLGKLIIEASEMAFIRVAEIETLKMFLSAQTDTVRFCYDKFATDVPRQSVMIGTINPDASGQYLRDTTGNRRFWPVLVRQLNKVALLQDIDQLWAEAIVRYNSGEKWYLTGELEELAVREQMSRMVRDPWVDLIAAYVAAVPNIVSLPTLAEYVLGIKHRLTSGDAARVRRIMTDLGWRREVENNTTVFRRQ